MAPMPCAFRYLLGQTFWPLVFVTIGIGGVIWLTQSLRFLDLVINKNLPLSTFLTLVVLVQPMMMSVLLPLAIFAAVMFAYNKLTMDSELVVLRASGLSSTALARPAIVLGCAVMALCYFLTLYLMPLAYREFKDLQFALRYDRSDILLQEGVFNTVSEYLTVYVRERTADGKLLGILVHDSRNPAKPVTIMSESGVLVQTKDGPRVIMANGNRQVVKRQQGELSLLNFDSYTFDFGITSKTPQSRRREATELYLHELFAYTGNPGRTRKLRAEAHQRITSPLLALAFVLIGLATLLSGEFNRRGQVKRTLLGVGLVVIIESASQGLYGLAAKTAAVIPLMYVNPIAVIAIAFYVLVYDPRRRKPSVESEHPHGA
jgi:lipopolysaccharide export system permease protein